MIRLLLLCLAFYYTLTTYAQQVVVETNNKKVDSVLGNQTFCQSQIKYPEKYKAKSVNGDIKLLRFINESVKDNNYYHSALIKEIKKKQGPVEHFMTGLIETENFQLKGSYVKADIIIENINDLKVRERIILTTRTKGSCSEFKDIMMDFNFVKSYIIKNIDLNVAVSLNEMVFDTIYFKSLDTLSKRYSDYNFNAPRLINRNWIDTIFLNQYITENSCCYQNLQPPAEFLRLVKEKQVDIIKSLLFSPNYFTSVNAMEALIYLSNLNKMTLTTAELKRIENIKQGNGQFKKQLSPDFFVAINGYKELQMTDDKIIAKYKSTINSPSN